MTLRSRVFLIIAGFVVFFLLGPAIVLFARGYTYDFARHRFLKTGTLVVKTDPRNAEIYLNNLRLGSSPLTKRLLPPDEYLVEIKKPGYFPWQKRVNVHPQGVSDLGHVVLFKEKPAPSVLATGTTDFLATGEDIYAAIRGDLVLFKFNATEKTILATSTSITNLAPKISPDGERIIYDNNEIWFARTSGEDEKFLITRSAEPIEHPVLNQATGYVFFQVGRLVKAIEVDEKGAPNTYELAQTSNPSVKFAVSPDGRALIYLDGGVLYRLDIR